MTARPLCFATNNRHKAAEIEAMLQGAFRILTLEDIGCREELPETQETLEGNSFQKAAYVWEKYGAECFADDTGLEVAALGNAPGVYSARYAGPERDSQKNMALLLENLKGKANRQARFRTVVTLFFQGKPQQFEGRCEGSILEAPRGEGGFGYDPVFLPEGHSLSFAEMPLASKNKISHRALAVSHLAAFLLNCP